MSGYPIQGVTAMSALGQTRSIFQARRNVRVSQERTFVARLGYDWASPNSDIPICRSCSKVNKVGLEIEALSLEGRHPVVFCTGFAVSGSASASFSTRQAV